MTAKGSDSARENTDFIRAIVEDDLASGRHTEVVTRFPPEPNGYLHIGHAKAICIDFGLAKEYGGRCQLRFDDTDPTKEEVEYVDAIQNDIKWLGFQWDELTFASDYYQKLYDYAEQLIKDGKAYVDSLSDEEIREYRGTVTEPGRPGPDREKPPEEHLDLFRRMRAGEFDNGALVLRAKIDLSSPNMKMRDPPIYRIRKVPHYRTGTQWCIYPLYDFAHCLGDSIEGVTHSVCTLEFENNRELYDWVIDNLPVPQPRPHQYEFARLNLTYTMMSKRRLKQLVDEGTVSGWDDPRMPTLAGLRRRGYTPEAIRNLCERVGVAKANSVVELEQLEFSIRDDLNHKAPRVLAVLDPLKVTLENYPQDGSEELEAPFWPHDVPKEGSRKLSFSRELFIERSDFEKMPRKGFKRLTPGGAVRLRHGFIIDCKDVIENSAGEVTELVCTYAPESKSGADTSGRKVKGTIHWVDAATALDADVRIYDRLFAEERPDTLEDWKAALNPESLVKLSAKVESGLATSNGGEHFQFERHGYFVVDSVDATPGKPVFNRVVALRDSWAKKGTPSLSPRERAKTVRTPAPVFEKTVIKAESSEAERYVNELGLSPGDANTLAGDETLAAFFETARAAHDNPQGIANWVVNDVLRESKDRPIADLPFGGEAIAELVALIDKKTISGKIAKDVFAELLAKGGSPAKIVKDKGLTQVSDASSLEPLVDQVIAENPDSAQKLRDGNRNVLGFFVGQVMKKSGGKANPQLVNELLNKKLG